MPTGKTGYLSFLVNHLARGNPPDHEIGSFYLLRVLIILHARLLSSLLIQTSPKDSLLLVTLLTAKYEILRDVRRR